MWNRRIARSHATTMTIRNRNGRTHAAFSNFDRPEGLFASATSRSLCSLCVRAEINSLDKYCLAPLTQQNRTEARYFRQAGNLMSVARMKRSEIRDRPSSEKVA